MTDRLETAPPTQKPEQTDKDRFDLGSKLADIALVASGDAEVSICLQTRDRFVPERPIAEVIISSPYFFTMGGVEFEHCEMSDGSWQGGKGTKLTRRLPKTGIGVKTDIIDDILQEPDGNLTRRRMIIKSKGLDVLEKEIVYEGPATDRTIIAMARLAVYQIQNAPSNSLSTIQYH